MPRQRRPQQVQLSFDGLTDSVTNLVGALVLLVVLLIAVTKEAVFSAATGQETRVEVAQEGEKSAEALIQRIEFLRARIRRTEREIRRHEAELPILRQQIDELDGDRRQTD